MVALSTRPPSRAGNGATSVPPPAKLRRSGALARTIRRIGARRLLCVRRAHTGGQVRPPRRLEGVGGPLGGEAREVARVPRGAESGSAVRVGQQRAHPVGEGTGVAG